MIAKTVVVARTSPAAGAFFGPALPVSVLGRSPGRALSGKLLPDRRDGKPGKAHSLSRLDCPYCKQRMWLHVVIRLDIILVSVH